MFKQSLVILAIVLCAKTIFAEDKNLFKKLSYRTNSDLSSFKLKEAEKQVEKKLQDALSAIDSHFKQRKNTLEISLNTKIDQLKTVFDKSLATLKKESTSIEENINKLVAGGKQRIVAKSAESEKLISEKLNLGTDTISQRLRVNKNYIESIYNTVLKDLLEHIAKFENELLSFINSMLSEFVGIISDATARIKALTKQCRKYKQVAPPIQLILPSNTYEEESYETTTEYESTPYPTRTTVTIKPITRESTSPPTPMYPTTTARSTTASSTTKRTTTTHTTSYPTTTLFTTPTTKTTTKETTYPPYPPQYPQYQPYPAPQYPQPYPQPAQPAYPQYQMPNTDSYQNANSVYTSFKKTYSLTN